LAKFGPFPSIETNAANVIRQINHLRQEAANPSTGSCRLARLYVLLPFLAAALTPKGFAAPDDPVGDPALSALKQLSVEQLMNVEVTSVSKQPERAFDTDAAIQVITGKDISDFGASSIPEALQLARNLDVAQKDSHDWAISARGFNTDLGNKLLVLMDGRTLYTPLFSGVFWDVQDYLLQDIDRIEVVSGPGGTLWGANAVNGVINITTKSAQDTQGLYLEGGGGSVLEDFTGARYGGVLAPGVYYRVYGKYFDRGDEALANGSPANDAWHMGQGGFRLDDVTAPDTTFTLQGDAYGGAENIAIGGTEQTSGGNLLGRWSHDEGGDSSMSLQAYVDRTHLSDPVPAVFLGPTQLAPAGTVVDDLDTLDLDFQHRLRFGDQNHLVWGLGYRFTRDTLDNAQALAFLPPTLDQNLFSAFAQDEISLQPNWVLTLGSKLEHNDYTGLEAEPTIRLRWNPTPSQTVWTAVSRAVRTPSRIDRDLSEPAAPALVLLEGGAAFDSEKLIAYEAGYRSQLTPQLVAGISLFYNAYTDVRSTSITPGTVLPFYFSNNLAGETHGFELSGIYQALPWWQLRAGYDLLLENIGVKPGAFDLDAALNETADPKNQFSVTSATNLPGNWLLTARLRWVGELETNNGPTVGTVPSYTELNARAAWRPIQGLELSVTGQNLLHPYHTEYGFPSPTREEIARGIYGKASWQY
jgi:iron complex outermembrane receptor protein